MTKKKKILSGRKKLAAGEKKVPLRIFVKEKLVDLANIDLAQLEVKYENEESCLQEIKKINGE